MAIFINEWLIRIFEALTPVVLIQFKITMAMIEILLQLET